MTHEKSQDFCHVKLSLNWKANLQIRTEKFQIHFFRDVIGVQNFSLHPPFSTDKVYEKGFIEQKWVGIITDHFVVISGTFFGTTFYKSFGILFL